MTSPRPTPTLHIIVAAAVVRRGDTFLLTRRLKGTHLEGLWEFPGGKCEPGEALDACLRREIVEELGVQAQVKQLLLSTQHTYREPGRETRHIELHFFACDLDAEPHARLGQEIRWTPRTELRQLNFPPADAELIDLLSASEAEAEAEADSASGSDS
jgi:8-oxo-dGTP diphosphatase